MNRNSNAIKARSSAFSAKRFSKDYNSNANLVRERSIIRSEGMLFVYHLKAANLVKRGI